jgi:ABC-2 type transport system ATP-binding protein
MAQTADHVVVIGRGRLLADCATSQLAGAAGDTVVVEAPDKADRDRLQAALARRGIAVTAEAGVLRAGTGDVGLVGDCAHDEGIRLHLLARESRTLEEGYLRLVEGQVEFEAASA